MQSAVPIQHRKFWDEMSLDELFHTYCVINATPSQVICAIRAPDDMNAAQNRVFNFLLSFVGNIKENEDVRRF